MKKLLTVVCLSGLLSVPSVVFAEANWYGSLRAGINSSGTTGVADGGSRFGVSGSSEVSEGLTAVYQFEHKINAANAGLGGGGRLAYVGLSGGFGTLTVGQIWSASYNSVGAITDNSFALGAGSSTSYRHGNAVSYAVSVENISIQVDALMNQSGGKTAGKTVDQAELGVSMGLGENGKIAFAHISHDTNSLMKQNSNFIAGEYTIGSMTAFLGASQSKLTDRTVVANKLANRDRDLAAWGKALNKIVTDEQDGVTATTEAVNARNCSYKRKRMTAAQLAHTELNAALAKLGLQTVTDPPEIDN